LKKRGKESQKEEFPTNWTVTLFSRKGKGEGDGPTGEIGHSDLEEKCFMAFEGIETVLPAARRMSAWKNGSRREREGAKCPFHSKGERGQVMIVGGT